MKITRDHLMGLENSLIDHTRDLTEMWLNDLNYGLLPTNDGNDPVAVDINSERVEIRRCQAITRGGARIDIPDNHNFSSLRRPMHEVFSGAESRNTEWYVVIKAFPFNRVPFGQPDSEETPYRHPFATPSYELSIVSKDQIASAYFDLLAIPVAKISDYNFGGKREDDQYIPPCTGVQAFSLLMEAYHRFGNYTNEIEESLFEIIKKTQKKRADQRSNTLAPDIETIAIKIIDFISLNKDNYDLLLVYQPPVHIVVWFSQLARVIKSSLRFLQSMDVMLAYFNFYIDKDSSTAFQNVIEKACTLTYDHLDIQSSIKEIENFLSFLNELFRQLKELKFEVFANPSIVEKVNYSSSQNVPPIKPSTRGPRIMVRPKTTPTQDPSSGSGRHLSSDLEDD